MRILYAVYVSGIIYLTKCGFGGTIKIGKYGYVVKPNE